MTVCPCFLYPPSRLPQGPGNLNIHMQGRERRTQGQFPKAIQLSDSLRCQPGAVLGFGKKPVLFWCWWWVWGGDQKWGSRPPPNPRGRPACTKAYTRTQSRYSCFHSGRRPGAKQPRVYSGETHPCHLQRPTSLVPHLRLTRSKQGSPDRTPVRVHALYSGECLAGLFFGLSC